MAVARTRNLLVIQLTIFPEVTESGGNRVAKPLQLMQETRGGCGEAAGQKGLMSGWWER